MISNALWRVPGTNWDFMWVTGTTQESHSSNLRSCAPEVTFAEIPGKTILTELDDCFRDLSFAVIIKSLSSSSLALGDCSHLSPRRRK